MEAGLRALDLSFSVQLGPIIHALAHKMDMKMRFICVGEAGFAQVGCGSNEDC